MRLLRSGTLGHLLNKNSFVQSISSWEISEKISQKAKLFYAILNKNSFVCQYLAEISVEKSQMSKIVPKWDKISAKLYKSGLRTKLIHSSISAKGWKPCLGCFKLLLLTKNGKSVHTLPNSDHSASTHELWGTSLAPNTNQVSDPEAIRQANKAR